MSVLEKHMAERRERILESARELIEIGGYDRLTMRDLAQASDVTVPTIYNLVGNKAQVLLAAVEEQTRAFVSALDRARGDLLELVEATVCELVHRPRYYRSLLMVLMRSGQTDAARRYAGQALGAQIDRALSDIEAVDELVDWVDRPVLAERIHAHIDFVSIDWARGGLTNVDFRTAALLDVTVMMLGVTTGSTRDRFERVARESQASALAGRGKLRAKTQSPGATHSGRAA